MRDRGEMEPSRGAGRKRAAYAYYLSPKYREAFHYALRAEMEARGHEYRFLYAKSFTNEAKGDTVHIPWAEDRPMKEIRIRGRSLLWHSIFSDARAFDLLITQQENRILTNYVLQILAPIFGFRIAFFGHGKNFQAKNPNSLAERWKRFWATKVHWWFAYTDSCADLVESYGFPRDKITTFNNAIDLSAIYEEIARATPQRLDALREDLCGGSENVAVYVGGMYAEKRLSFLVEALDHIRATIPDFHAIFMGAGPDDCIIKTASETRPWIRYVGPKFGQEKTDHALLAKAWLMPGLVGLAVLDSFAYETPMITTALPYHSPEFDYLEDGVNGVIVRESGDAAAYGDAVIRVLRDDAYRAALVAGGQAARQKYSIEEMARRFADGIEGALK